MVTSVEAVSGISKLRRDERHNSYTDSRRKGAEGLFASILEENTRETREEPVECRTTTYGRDSKVQNFVYQTREYRY